MKAFGASVQGYSHGGMVTKTGYVKVHGTRARPEAFMNADDVNMWKEEILSSDSHSLRSQILRLNALFDSLSSITTVNNDTTPSVVIEHAEMNMNVEKIADDYDARRAGEQALDEMLKIARKAGMNSVRR